MPWGAEMKARYWICLVVASAAFGFMLGIGNRAPYKWEARKTSVSWNPAWQQVHGDEMNKGDTCTMIQNDCWQTVLRNVQERSK